MKTVQREKRVIMMEPKDINGAVTMDNAWLNMKHYQHATIHIITGVLGGAIAVSLDQATDGSGTGSKTLSFTEMYVADNSDATAANRDKFSRTAVASDTFTIAATDDTKHYMIEIDSSQLDRDGGFDWINVDLGDPAAASFVTVVAEMKAPRFVGNEDSNDLFPSALA